MVLLSLTIMPMLQIVERVKNFFPWQNCIIRNTCTPQSRDSSSQAHNDGYTWRNSKRLFLDHCPQQPTNRPYYRISDCSHAFDWIIPEFNDSDGDVFTYSATLADGSPLPDWVSFNSTTRNLSGVVPPVVSTRRINIQADDSYGDIVNAIQTINVVNAAPIAGPAALPNQNVELTYSPFNFSLDPNVFIDLDGDPLTYSATLANQQPLPDWLTFNQTGGIFTGTAPADSAGVDIGECHGCRSFWSDGCAQLRSNVVNNPPLSILQLTPK